MPSMGLHFASDIHLLAARRALLGSCSANRRLDRQTLGESRLCRLEFAPVLKTRCPYELWATVNSHCQPTLLGSSSASRRLIARASAEGRLCPLEVATCLEHDAHRVLRDSQLALPVCIARIALRQPPADCESLGEGRLCPLEVAPCFEHSTDAGTRLVFDLFIMACLRHPQRLRSASSFAWVISPRKSPTQLIASKAEARARSCTRPASSTSRSAVAKA